jgi:hypothetical protein
LRSSSWISVSVFLAVGRAALHGAGEAEAAASAAGSGALEPCEAWPVARPHVIVAGSVSSPEAIERAR